MLITAAMIVRNEEAFLGACLRSLAGVADEVVIVDTGSADRTKEIALEHGARVADFAWTDDFSAARNRALDLARGEWILYIDADEQVRPGTAERVRSQLAGTPSRAGEYAWLHPRPEHTAYRVLRLFRNDPEIRFEGVIHETMWPSLHRYCAAHNGDIGNSELVLDHFGYENNQERKHARNLPLLLRAVDLDPLRIYAWCHLADTYRLLGNDELAEQTWLRAIAIVRTCGEGLGDSTMPFSGLIGHYFAKGRDTAALLREARQRDPEDLQLIWLESQIHMKSEMYAAAILLLERLIAHGSMSDPGLPSAYDKRLFTLYPYRALAHCHFRLKNYGASRNYFGLASACDPACQEYRVKEALCSRLEAGAR